MFDMDTQKERVVLVAVEDERTAGGAEAGLDELALLVETSGAVVVGRLIQKREKVHPGHYLGKGKIDELKALAQEQQADGVVCDDELTSAQQRKMAQMLDVKIMDRTMVILDIFAGRAVSAEGKAQVELAQLKYRMSHLTGLGIQLSRQAGGGGFAGGGIGTRGPGEKKLETDRRHIQSRVNQLNRELEEIRESRNILREKRVKNGVPVVALVGYTNAGKSTLMNKLTQADVLAENKLFATLDTTTRRMELPGGSEVLLTDTVGFINKLPHHLIQAFRATLEELQYADILLHVVDASNPAYDEQMRVVYQTLQSLGLHQPVVTAYNKVDLCGLQPRSDEVSSEAPPISREGQDSRALSCVSVSAVTGFQIETLLAALESVLQSMRHKITVLIPYQSGQLVNLLHDTCEILSEAYEENGVLIEAYANGEVAGRLEVYTQ